MVKTDTSISEQQMKLYYESLSEKDRRRYSAIEAQKIGYGGIQYISQLFKCNYRTIRQGFADLKQFDLISNPRIRNPGGGRKKVHNFSNAYSLVSTCCGWNTRKSTQTSITSP